MAITNSMQENLEQILEIVKFGANFGNLIKFWKISNFIKFYQILEILSNFGNFIKFWKFYQILEILSNFGNFIKFWKFYQILEILSNSEKKNIQYIAEHHTFGLNTCVISNVAYLRFVCSWFITLFTLASFCLGFSIYHFNIYHFNSMNGWCLY